MRFSFTLALLLAALPAPAEVLERVLAAVGGRPVMLSEVEMLAAIRGVDRKTALEATIDSRLMFLEASRLPQAAADADEEEKAYLSLAERVPPGAHPEAELRALARREAVILKYVAFRFGSRIRVTDEAIRAAYQAAYGGREDAPELSAVTETLRHQLEARELDQQIEAWVREIRNATEIRYNP